MLTIGVFYSNLRKLTKYSLGTQEDSIAEHPTIQKFNFKINIYANLSDFFFLILQPSTFFIRILMCWVIANIQIKKRRDVGSEEIQTKCKLE